MKEVIKKIVAGLLLPVGVVMTAAIGALVSILWIPMFFGCALNSLMWNVFEQSGFYWVDSLEEFIFLGYGFALVWSLIPMGYLSADAV